MYKIPNAEITNNVFAIERALRDGQVVMDRV